METNATPMIAARTNVVVTLSNGSTVEGMLTCDYPGFGPVDLWPASRIYGQHVKAVRPS